MPLNEDLMEKMDEALSAAQVELDENLDRWSARDLIEWWKRWYLKAGHKRLGRALVAVGKKSGH